MSWNTLNAWENSLYQAIAAALRPTQGSGGMRQQRGGTKHRHA
jgi:hypothetical protein